MLTAQRMIQEWTTLGITHVVGLPDNSTAALFDHLAADHTVQLVTVAREGEAFATAAGLWIGGKQPLVLIQNTGFLESGDALRGMVTRMRIPIVCLIGYRGFHSLPNPAPALPTLAELTRPDIDSAALLLEPTLRAWGIPYEFLSDDDDLIKLAAAHTRAQNEMRPVALLITETVR